LIVKGKLLTHATPEEFLQEVEGKVWECIVPSTELARARERHLISNTVHRSDGVHARVVSKEPPPGAVPLPPNLEDAYLYFLVTRTPRVGSGVGA
jgi:ABC-2 type transport system ATP-binding protein